MNKIHLNLKLYWNYNDRVIGCQVCVILPVHSVISQELFAFRGICHFELRIALISPADTTLTEPQNSPLQIALIFLATATDFTGFPGLFIWLQVTVTCSWICVPHTVRYKPRTCDMIYLFKGIYFCK